MHKFLRWGMISLALPISLLSLLLLSLYLLLQTDAGKMSLLAFINWQLADADGTKIVIHTMQGNPFQRFSISGLTLLDDSGELLQLDSAVLEWRPAALFAGEFRITDLQLSGLLINGSTSQSALETRGLNNTIQILEHISVDQLLLENATLAAAVLGETISFAAKANISVNTQGSKVTRINLYRTDHISGKLQLLSKFQAQSTVLDMQFSMHEAPGGILNRLLDIEKNTPLSIQANGYGPLENWQGKLNFRAAENAVMDINFTMNLTDRWMLQANMQANLSPLATEPISSLIDGILHIDTRLVIDNNRISLNYFDYQSDLAKFNVRGLIDAEKIGLDTLFALTPAGIAHLNQLSTPLVIQGLQFTAKILGPLLQPEISMHVSAASPSLETVLAKHFQGLFNITFDKPFNQSEATALLQAQGKLTGLLPKSTSTGTTSGQNLNWSVSGRGNLADDIFQLHDASITTDFARLAANGKLGLKGSPSILKLKANIDDLTPLSPFFQQPLSGSVQATAQLYAKDIQQGLTGSVTSKINDLAIGETAIDPLLQQELLFNSKISLLVNDHWAFEDIIVKSKFAKIVGNIAGSQLNNTLQGSYQLQIPSLNDFSKIAGAVLSGQLTAQGKITGMLTSPEVSTDISATKLSISDIDMGNLNAQLHARKILQNPQGEINIQLHQGGFPGTQATAQFFYTDTSGLEFRALNAGIRNMHLTGHLQIPQQGPPYSGKLTGTIADLDLWKDLIGQEISGAAQFTVELSAVDTSQHALVHINANNLLIAADTTKRMSVEKVTLSMELSDLLTTPKGQMSIHASNAQLQDGLLTSLQLQAKMDKSAQVDFKIDGTGELQGPFQLNLQGQYSRHDKETEYLLTSLSALLAGQPITLRNKMRIKLLPESTFLEKTDFSIAKGSLSTAGMVTKQKINGLLDMQNVPLALANIFSTETDFTGKLSGKIQVAGSRSSPNGSINLNITEFQPATPIIQSTSKISGHIQGNWEHQRLHLNAELGGIMDNQLQIQGSIPLRLPEDSLLMLLPQDEPIDGKISWTGELAPIWDLLTTREDSFSGQGNLLFNARGSLAAPEITGQFDISHGEYQNIDTGTLFSDITMKIKAQQNQLVLETLTANDGSAGSIQGHGALDLNPAQHFPLRLQLAFNDTMLVARDDISIIGSGDLLFNGNFYKSSLNGKVITQKIELNLDNKAGTDIVELQVEEINLPDDHTVYSKPQAKTNETRPTLIDLQISIPGKAYIRGMGLDSEWKGDMSVTGDTHKPEISGTLEPVRGYFSLLGKNFELQRGSIRTNGGQEINPLLNLSAEYQTTGLTAILTVSGTAAQPKITLSSRPSLPQSEIVSRILFGTDSKSLTVAQSLQLASSLASLSGLGGTGGILDLARRTLGIDVIKFKESKYDSTATRMSVGKYISDDLYIEVEQGTNQDSYTSTTIEWEVLPNIKIVGGSTEKGGGKAGFKWKWDY
jgi:translocation and assembly module TamB